MKECVTIVISRHAHIYIYIYMHESPLVTCVPNIHLKSVTIPDAVLIQFDLLKMSTIVLETCTGV